jgi:hypothetical protein
MDLGFTKIHVLNGPIFFFAFFAAAQGYLKDNLFFTVRTIHS